jgi:hypothetical protein
MQRDNAPFRYGTRKFEDPPRAATVYRYRRAAIFGVLRLYPVPLLDVLAVHLAFPLPVNGLSRCWFWREELCETLIRYDHDLELCMVKVLSSLLRGEGTANRLQYVKRI